MRMDRELPPKPKCRAISRVILSASLRSDGEKGGVLRVTSLSTEAAATGATGAGADVSWVTGFLQSSVSSVVSGVNGPSSGNRSLLSGPLSPRCDLVFTEIGMRHGCCSLI